MTLMGNDSQLKTNIVIKHPMIRQSPIIILKGRIITIWKLDKTIFFLADIQYTTRNNIGIDSVSITQLQLKESIMLFIVVKSSRNTEIKPMLLESVTSFEAKSKLHIITKRIASSYIKLIYKSLAFGITHIKRIQNRINSKVPLILFSEILLDTI